ncbi:methyltransferase type 11 [Sedimentibacter sp. MB31-C6]|uniref:methyltransferase type 11 n=1 Tax=Sedimentibacter sp. MB31-C6 TaxID=3109366 RepID=UPI002DDCF7F1|nr:methyltransferase type 11 [Sedimentibacter sp. MB36-C1]WSI03657.1 methyltransferase type 11 [Sedimentibacter sp. MB36-C1]
MSSPWERIPLDDYENHMKLSTVQQLQKLNEIMKSQIDKYNIETVAILGVAGGNGLEHIDCSKIKVVYGIDINQDYLDVCKEKYKNLDDYLVLKKLDLADIANDLPVADIIIANLFIEYIGIDMFIKQLSKKVPPFVSCVIQKNLDINFVSDSPYTEVFEEISLLHRNIDKNSLVNAMSTIGYSLIIFEEHLLPNMKEFIRLDFTNNKIVVRHSNVV